MRLQVDISLNGQSQNKHFIAHKFVIQIYIHKHLHKQEKEKPPVKQMQNK